jgi:DNA-binding NtrC family response regulator
MHENHTEQLVGTSVAIRYVLEDIGYAATTDAKVLITGESGVGKEIVAHLLHAGSKRADAPFVTLNCAGVPESLLESELFGHTRGSFTGAVRDRAGLLELAHGGTLFMDEVGEMSLRMQALLLRFLETGEIQRVGGEQRQAPLNVRLVTATNRDLLEQIAAKAFREDLYYRLNVIHVTIPPLRERREDIPLLAEHFLVHFAKAYATPVPKLTPEMLDRMDAYDWPGNVRELRNLTERLVVWSRHRRVTVSDLPVEIRPNGRAAAGARPAARADDLYRRLVVNQETFWAAVYVPFMQRDLTREDLREVIARGLDETRGSYMTLLQLFNLERADYKRFLNVLHKHGCHLPVALFKAGPVRRPLPARATGTFDSVRSA